MPISIFVVNAKIKRMFFETHMTSICEYASIGMKLRAIHSILDKFNMNTMKLCILPKTYLHVVTIAFQVVSPESAQK